MVGRLRSWWQSIRKRLGIVGIIIACALVIALIVVIVLGYWFNWDWVGLGTYTPPTKDSNFQRGKTLWDWLQLLIIPAVLIVGGFFLNLAITTNERKIAQKRDETAHNLAKESLMASLLQNYFDQISALLIEHDLLSLDAKAEIRYLARARTLTVLSQLDETRKESIIQFLHEANLIKAEGNTVINLEGADLSWVQFLGLNLSGANLNRADFYAAQLSEIKLDGASLIETVLEVAWLDGGSFVGANLSEAYLGDVVAFGADFTNAILKGAILRDVDLRKANLTSADLTGANLTGADLSDAVLKDAKVTDEQLKQAKSLKGATMPDGSIHP